MVPDLAASSTTARFRASPGLGYIDPGVMRRGLIGVGAVVLSVAVARAETLTLTAALARAHRDSPELAVAGATLDAARGRLTQAGVFKNPVLTSGATRHRIPGAVNAEPHVSLDEEIEVGGQRGLRIGAAKHDVARVEFERADHLRSVDAEVRRAFAGLVAAERRRELAREGARAAQHIARAAVEHGIESDSDRVDADLSRLDAIKADSDAMAADTDALRARVRLALVIGASPDEPLSVAPPDDAPATAPPSEDGAVARALAARPDLAAARAERRRLDGEADLTHRVGRIPNPTIRGYYSHENGDEELVGGEIEVPLPLFDRQVGAEAELRGLAAAAAAEASRLERQIPRDVHTALAHYQAAAVTWNRHRRESLPTMASARAALERTLHDGRTGIIEVLVQQTRLRDLDGNVVAAWLDLREAEAEVIETIGESPW